MESQLCTGLCSLDENLWSGTSLNLVQMLWQLIE
jgi:hypothetical protein